MKSKNGIYIHLDNVVRSYFPGQLISGKVVVTNDKPKEIKKIQLTFLGKARVHWTETRTETVGVGKDSRRVNRTVHFTADEEYFKYKVLLFEAVGTSLTLPPGIMNYPFQFTLPPNLPSSFTSRTGMVSYLVEAKMSTRGWIKSDPTAIVPFTVNGILDLNLEPALSQPFNHEKQKNVCCLCCKSGPVGYKINIPKRGFVPGEFALFNGEFMNHSRRKMKCVRVSLVQVATFHAQGARRVESKVICTAQSPPIERGEDEFWGGEILRIPPVPPTRLGNCRIIDVQYWLKFELDISGMTVNMKLDVPITIGTIPFRSTFVNFAPFPFAQPSMPLVHPVAFDTSQPGFSGTPYVPNVGPETLALPSAPAFEAYPDLPPPSYAEAMQTENFDDQPEGDEKVAVVNQGFANQEDNMATAPEESDIFPNPLPPYNFVPNYVTYGYRQELGK